MKNILIVDDSMVIQNLFSRHLSRNPNYRLFFAEDGEAALEAVHENMPDLIILDVVLPRINGIAFLKSLRKTEQTRELPVILVSGEMTDEDFKEEGRRLGAIDYLEKPVDLDYLLEKAGEVLGE